MSTPEGVGADLSSVDLCDLDRFASGFPHEVFVALRHRAPVWWHEPTTNVPGGEGFWVVSTHAQCLEAAADSSRFSSQTGPGRDGAGGTLIEDLPGGFGAGVLLNMMDDPLHQRLRSVLTPALSPRALRVLRADLEERARRICDAAVAKGRFDLLTDVAAELPLQAAAGLLGVPLADRHLLIEWADATLDLEDRELGVVSDRAAAASGAMFEYGSALVERRRRDPGDDLLSAAVHCTVDDVGGPRPLSPLELQMLFSLLVAAGTETTRNTIAVGVAALCADLDQWDAVRDDAALRPTAVEEMARWASSTTYNRRTATGDTELGGVAIAAGDKVTLWWTSANRDEAEFPDPFRFDVRRSPNRHLAFGHGAHFCMGARLARIEIDVVLAELGRAAPRLEQVGDVEWTRSNKHGGVRHLPVRVVPSP